ncbi:MAG: shikimate dehydrogenase, partial [Porcipelethomonas sp.]
CANVFDAVYNPKETVLVKKAKKLGKNAVGGMSMLVLQAVAAHEIWYGAAFTKAQTDNLILEASEAMEKMFG